MINEGDVFPEFSLTDQNGVPVTRESLKAAKTIVFFYPKDDTSGCTIEACEFRDSMPNFEGVTVIGVSPDSETSHLKFIKKFDLNYRLLADTEKALAQACGVWVEKSMYGKKYMGVARTTFLLDENALVLKIWRQVKPEGHAEEVLAAIKAHPSKLLS